MEFILEMSILHSYKVVIDSDEHKKQHKQLRIEEQETIYQPLAFAKGGTPWPPVPSRRIIVIEGLMRACWLFLICDTNVMASIFKVPVKGYMHIHW